MKNLSLLLSGRVPVSQTNVNPIKIETDIPLSRFIHLLSDHPTDEIIAKPDANIIYFKQLFNSSAVEYWQALWTKPPVTVHYMMSTN